MVNLVYAHERELVLRFSAPNACQSKKASRQLQGDSVRMVGQARSRAMHMYKSVYRFAVHFLNGFEGVFEELSSSPIVSYVILLSLDVISVRGNKTKINTVTTRQLGEMSIVGRFRLSEHSGPL
jgi:hypothetical protein